MRSSLPKAGGSIMTKWLCGVVPSTLAALIVPATAIGQQPFVQFPTGEQFARFYPQRAMELGTEGQAAIGCAVDKDGHLSACEVLLETPEGLGFGGAALRMAAFFRMNPKAVSVLPDRRVRLPIYFRLATGRTPERVVEKAILKWLLSLRKKTWNRHGQKMYRAEQSRRCAVISSLG